MRSVLKYPGSKGKVLNWLCSMIPKHDVYLEPFFGSGSVFFNKPKARIETINDLDGEVVNYFKVVREHPYELGSALSFTPYSRDEYKNAYKVNMNDNDIERARKFAVRCWMGFGCSNCYQNGFRSSQQRISANKTKAWRILPDTIALAADRLMDAQIENLPALELIHRYNTEDVFIYADPPYPLSVRKGYLYTHEMHNDSEHIELLEALISHPGKVLISGYENSLYDDLLKGWIKKKRKSQTEKGALRVECVWMNYDLP